MNPTTERASASYDGDEFPATVEAPEVPDADRLTDLEFQLVRQERATRASMAGSVLMQPWCCYSGLVTTWMASWLQMSDLLL
jgi:hypothetical protein